MGLVLAVVLEQGTVGTVASAGAGVPVSLGVSEFGRVSSRPWSSSIPETTEETVAGSLGAAAGAVEPVAVDPVGAHGRAEGGAHGRRGSPEHDEQPAGGCADDLHLLAFR